MDRSGCAVRCDRREVYQCALPTVNTSEPTTLVKTHDKREAYARMYYCCVCTTCGTTAVSRSCLTKGQGDSSRYIQAGCGCTCCTFQERLNVVKREPQLTPGIFFCLGTPIHLMQPNRFKTENCRGEGCRLLFDSPCASLYYRLPLRVPGSEQLLCAFATYVGNSRPCRARRPSTHVRRHATLGSRATGALPFKAGGRGRGRWRRLRAGVRRPDGDDQGAQREVPYQAEDAGGVQVCFC